MESALGTLLPAIAENGLSFVVFGAVAFSIVMSLLFLVTRGSDNLYDHIGRGGLTRESDYAGGMSGAGGDSTTGDGSGPESAAARTEREQEVRQMIAARSERRVRRGEAPLDVDAEVARLLAPAAEVGAGDRSDGPAPGLVQEVRQLVLARNERRVRQGLEPLDVEAEVTRTLTELGA